MQTITHPSHTNNMYEEELLSHILFVRMHSDSHELHSYEENHKNHSRITRIVENHLRIIENHLRIMRITCKSWRITWKSLENHENPLRIMKIVKNHQNCLRIIKNHENCWESFVNHQETWELSRIMRISPESSRITWKWLSIIRITRIFENHSRNIQNYSRIMKIMI